jgi:hypothetical protein
MQHPIEPEPDKPEPPAEPPVEPSDAPIDEPHHPPPAVAARRRVGLILH